MSEDLSTISDQSNDQSVGAACSTVTTTAASRHSTTDIPTADVILHLLNIRNNNNNIDINYTTTPSPPPLHYNDDDDDDGDDDDDDKDEDEDEE